MLEAILTQNLMDNSQYVLPSSSDNPLAVAANSEAKHLAKHSNKPSIEVNTAVRNTLNRLLIISAANGNNFGIVAIDTMSASHEKCLTFLINLMEQHFASLALSTACSDDEYAISVDLATLLNCFYTIIITNPSNISNILSISTNLFSTLWDFITHRQFTTFAVCQVYENVLSILSVIFAFKTFNNLTDFIIKCEKNPKLTISTLLYNVIYPIIVMENSGFLFGWFGGSVQSLDSLKDKSFLFLIILISHKSSQFIYKPCIKGLTNDDQDILIRNVARVSFKQIFEFLCTNGEVEKNVLITYNLLVNNLDFREYLVKRTDIDRLIVRYLQFVYQGAEEKTNFSQLYITLIILLIFTQSDNFCLNCQKIMVNDWSLDWLMSSDSGRSWPRSMSLANLIFLVITRCIHQNITKIRDIYVHTNSFAILSNLTHYIVNMNRITAQKLISLYEKTAADMKTVSPVTSPISSVQNGEPIITSSDSSIPNSPNSNQQQKHCIHEYSILLLEIFNQILVNQTTTNPQFVYELLLKKDLFVFLNNNASDSDDLNYKNILQVINEIKIPPDSEAEDALKAVEEQVKTFPVSKLQQGHNIKFKYEENLEVDEFFSSYINSILYRFIPLSVL